MHQDQDVLMMSIKRFYSHAGHVGPVVGVIRGTSPASLRLIEWFVTNHAKRNDVVISSRGEQINVHHSYRAALKTFSKEQFDPFRRHERIRFVYGDGEGEAIETTVGQLNFFKWATETGVLDYICENKESIERQMVGMGQARRGRGKAAVPAAAPPARAVRHVLSTTLSFD